MLNKVVEFIILITFAHEILQVDGVWIWWGLIYEELKDKFEENKHGFNIKSHTLTHFVTSEEWRTYH